MLTEKQLQRAGHRGVRELDRAIMRSLEETRYG